MIMGDDEFSRKVKMKINNDIKEKKKKTKPLRTRNVGLVCLLRNSLPVRVTHFIERYALYDIA